MAGLARDTRHKQCAETVVGWNKEEGGSQHDNARLDCPPTRGTPAGHASWETQTGPADSGRPCADLAAPIGAVERHTARSAQTRDGGGVGLRGRAAAWHTLPTRSNGSASL